MTTCQVRIRDRLIQLANTDAYLILAKKDGQWLPKGTSLVYQGHPGIKNPDRARLLQKVILSEILPDIHYTPTDLPSGSCEPGTAISKGPVNWDLSQCNAYALATDNEKMMGSNVEHSAPRFEPDVKHTKG